MPLYHICVWYWAILLEDASNASMPLSIHIWFFFCIIFAMMGCVGYQKYSDMDLGWVKSMPGAVGEFWVNIGLSINILAIGTLSLSFCYTSSMQWWHSVFSLKGQSEWSKIELMVCQNGRYWQSSFPIVFFCYERKASWRFKLFKKKLCKKVFCYLLIWVKVFVPHQVCAVKTPSGHKTPSSPSNQPLGK